MLIGRAKDCQICIDDPAFELKHALLTAEKMGKEIHIYMEPLGQVKMGAIVAQGRVQLSHKKEFEIGNYTFQYLSETGI